MPRLTRRARRALGEERRRQILSAAVRVFAQKGYARATIEDIARGARVAEGTIYNYFRGKEDLLAEMPRYLVGPVVDQIRAEFRDVRSVADAERVLRSLGEAMAERATTHTPFIRVFLSALPYLRQQAREEYLRLLPLAAAGMLEDHLRDGIARGLYRRDLEPAIAARALPGILLVFVLWQEVLIGRKILPFAYEEIIAEAVHLFLYGVADGRPARSRSRRRATA